MANSKYQELLNMGYRATNGAGAAFSKGEDGKVYVNEYTSGGQKQKTVFQPPQMEEAAPQQSKFDELMQMAYDATGGKGAAFSTDEEGNTYYEMWEPKSKTASEAVDERVEATTAPDSTEEKKSLWERIKGFFTRDRGKNILEAAGAGTAAGYTGAMRTLYETGQGGRDRENRELLTEYEQELARVQRDMEYYLEEAGGDTTDRDVVSQQYIIDDWQRKVDAMRLVVEGNVQQRATEATTELTRGLEARTQRATEAAKTGTGKVGSFAVDAAINMLQMGGDAVAGLATGGNNLIPMAFRVFGQGASEAQQAGADLAHQLGYGATTAGIEVFTEKLFDGVAGIYGRGSADEVTARLIRRMAKTPVGRTAARTLLGMIEEGGEEVISDILSPAAQMIYNGQGLRESYGENFSWDDVLYDFLIGAAVSGGMNAVNVANPLPGQGTIAQNRAENVQLAQVDEVERAYQQQGVTGRQADTLAWATQKVIEGEQLGRREQSAYDSSPVAQQVTEEVRTARESAAEKVTGRGYIQQVINSLDASESAAKVLMEGYETGTASATDYAVGIRDAYNLGKMGLTLEQATKTAKQGAALNETQFRHAWSLGAGGQTAETNAVDVSTAEGQEKLTASLSALGKHAEAAAKVYEAGQDSSRYAAAMNKAAALYAANGADLQRIYEDAKSGKSSDIISYLSQAQIEAAAEIGAQIRTERQAEIRASSERYTQIRQQAAALVAEDATNTQALTNINKAIEAAREYGQQEQDSFKRLVGELEAMVAADPESQGTEAYNKAYDKALEHRRNVENTQEGLKQLEEKRKELQEKQPVKRKKGTVSFEGGEIDGRAVKGVDREKLTRQQKNVVAMVEALADAVNIDYVFFDGDAKGTQGAYLDGGMVYININAGLAANKTLAAATLSHELTHYMKQYAPAEYEELKQFIIDSILKANPAELDALVKKQLRLEPNLSYEEALDEVVANACQTMLLDSKAVTELARQNMSLAEKVADVIEDIKAKIVAAFEEVNSKDDIGLYKAVRAIEGEMDRVQELWDKGIRAATENYNAVQTTETKNTATEGGVKYMKTDDTETASIKEQIQANTDMLNGMRPAASVRVSDMPKGIQKQRQWILNRLKSSGYAVSNQKIGTIEFTPRQINTGLSYLNEPGEIAAFAALPAVLKRGEIIDEHEKHKGRQRGSITIAAPVVINGVRGNMAVALTQTTKTHYHTHRIVMPDGSTFVFENANAEATPAEDQPEKAHVSRPSLRRSEESVTENLTEVKTRHQEWDEMSDEEKQAEINATMTMQQAQAMVQKAFVAAGIRDWYDGEYKNGDQWLKAEGSSEIAMYIENEYELQRKYINSNPHLVDYDFTMEEVLDAYLAGTLTGRRRAESPRVDVSRSRGYQDNRFYAPHPGDANMETWNKANEKSTKKNQAEVMAARKSILLAAHEEGLEKKLGITASELNKKLRSWSRYSSSARSLSMRINSGVAPENQWTGIQNSSILNGMSITDEDIQSMVKGIRGESSEYQRGYIGNAMLALDTHIDWSWLTFDFKRGNADENRKSVRGFFDNSQRLIVIGGSSIQNTVSHEMGHALDYQWTRELFGAHNKNESPLSQNALVETLIPDEEGRIFYRNFRRFIDDLMDVSDNYSNYTMEPTEIFARFVAKFVEWTQETAGAYTYRDSYIGFSDKFTTKNYMDFAKLLQEKAAWDAKHATETTAKHQQWDDLSTDELLNEIVEKQKEWNEAREALLSMKPEADKAADRKLPDGSFDLDYYRDWLQSSGYNRAYMQERVLNKELSDLRKLYDSRRSGEMEAEERETIEKSGLSEEEYFAKQAVKEFGYTPYFYDAGYIMLNGKMLNFSGEKGRHFGSRGQDHRAIGTIFATSEMSEAMNRFINYGNIRIMAEAPGLDISAGHEPTAEQYRQIRSFARESMDEGYFAVDFTSDSGGTVGTLEYEDTIRPERVVNDIKHYYQTGEIRETSTFYQQWDDETPVQQEISSAATSINANKLPVLYTNKNAVFTPGGVNVDVGGGRFDNVTEYLGKQGVRNLIFDPYNRDEQHNRGVLMYLTDGNQADTATCSNCLNVIKEEAARRNVILECAKAIKPDGKAYFTVYEGDGSGEGKVTKSGWQENRKTASYVPEIEQFFDKVTPHGKIIVAENPKTNLPRAAWETSPGKATRFQQWDNTEDDTAAEQNGRELAYNRLQSENALLTEAVNGLKKLTDKQSRTIERLQERLHLTKTAEVRESDARKFAAQLIRENDSMADKGKIAAELKALGDYILQTPATEIREAEIKARARTIAAEILENAQTTFETDAEVYREIRESIRGKKLTIRPEFLGELDASGGYDEFRKRNFGKFTLAKSDSESIDHSQYMTVDQFYTDIAAEYPGIFPQPGDDMAKNEGDYIQILASMFDAGEGITVNPFDSYMGEASEELANRIAFQAFEGVMRPTAPTDADRAKSRREALQEQVRELKAQGKLDEKTERELVRTVYDLTLALDKAESKYKSLRAEADYRTNQVREEGTARAAEIKARERERAAEKIQALKEHYQDITKRARERREESAGITKYRAQVQKKAGKLYEMLMKNDDKVHVPEVLKGPLAKFLTEIDFSSKRLLGGGEETRNDKAFGARLMQLQQILSNQQDYINGTGEMKEDLGGYVDVSPESLEFLRNTAELITKALGENRSYTINQMNAAQLKDLSNFLSSISSAIRNMNRFMANARYESVREAASGDVDYMGELGKAGESSGNRYRNALVWKNGVPYYIFKRFGAGGQSIFEGFTKGWEKMAFNAQEIIKFTEDAYEDKEVATWKKQEHEIELSDGSKITMTTGQIMELSMLLNREQALKHIERGGIRIGDIETRKGKKHDTAHYHLSYSDIMKITGLLTERQRTVAKALQNYMAVKGAEWGNEISMRRFGYNFYTEGENYYPIRTDSNDRAMADTDAQTNSMFRLLNLSSSKALNPKASNALIVGDIFDTFADHMSDMAKLNGMGLPILDAIKWFNYKERIDREDGTYDTRTLQAAMEEAFGGQAQHYFRTLMKDINGVTESGDRGADVLSGLMGNFKAAAVGANLRVALLQPTSYVRALTVIKPQYLAAAFAHRNAYNEAMENSGSAVWKSLGYYDTDISKGMRGQIQHNDSFRDKIVEASMKGAELGDRLTWGRLWVACKLQAKAENRGLSGKALMEATGDLFREVIYSSQVMDSTLTRSEWMRSKSNFDKLFTPFMAEPTLSYNILLNAASNLSLDERRYGKAEGWRRNASKIGHAYIVYLASAAFNALAESIWDAVRDDDDYESFLEKFLQALFGEDSPLDGNLLQDILITNKLPIIKDLWSMLSGYSSSNIATDSIRNIYNAAQIWWETYQLATGALDKATKVTSYGAMTPWGKIYKTLQALSQLSGVPAAGFSRDAIAIWNTIMDGRRDDWKLHTYESSADKKRRAFAGTLTELGLPTSMYSDIMSEADGNTDGKLNQDEIGPWLLGKLDSGEITQEQAEAIWAAAGPTWKTDFAKWSGKGSSKTSGSGEPAKTTTTTTPKTTVAFTPAAKTAPAETAAVADFESFKNAVPLYGNEKKQATYGVWQSTLQPSGMTLERFTQILSAADTSGNDSLTQDELGYALRSAINSGEMTFDQASAVWAAQGWSANHGFSWWSGKH